MTALVLSLDDAHAARAFPGGQDLPFHELANLFPLIEGKEFDDLVASIREEGLLDPIVLLDGAILDGRNRYRACKVAGAEPRFERYLGDNPARFVAAKNVHRRNLTVNERALIAAKMAGLANGSNQFSSRPKDEGVVVTTPSVSLGQAAEIMGVSRDTVACAKMILDHGCETDIGAVKKGAGIRPMADKIRAAMTPEERAAQESDREARQNAGNRSNPDRQRTQQMHAEIWDKLRAGLEGLTALPLPADVVKIVNGNAARRRTADAKQAAALAWLSDFSRQWEARNG